MLLAMTCILKRFCLLATFLLAVYCFASEAAAESQLPAADFTDLKKTGSGRVEAIIDPLTIKLDKDRTVHLTGLNYPDLDPYSPGPLSVTATDILKDMLVGRHVEIFQTKGSKKGNINRMGHIVAHIRRADDQVWVQGTILRLGLARVKTEKKASELSGQMYIYEQMAIRESLGLWSKKDYKIHAPENLEWAIGSFQIVQGRVKSVSMNENRTFLNFGDDWRTDFTVTIPPSEMKVFYSMETTPQGWNGKLIRVRGWVSALNGPSMEINHPEAIQLLEIETDKDTKPPPQQKKNKMQIKDSGLPEVN